jgi:hypothetical protein
MIVGTRRCGRGRGVETPLSNVSMAGPIYMSWNLVFPAFKHKARHYRSERRLLHTARKKNNKWRFKINFYLNPNLPCFNGIANLTAPGWKETILPHPMQAQQPWTFAEWKRELLYTQNIIKSSSKMTFLWKTPWKQKSLLRNFGRHFWFLKLNLLIHTGLSSLF